jgi:hypothetical protein
MKNAFQYTLTALAIIWAPLAAFAVEDGKEKEPEYDLPTYEFVDVISLPKPTSSPMPRVKSRLVGTRLKIKFTVTAKGKAENVRLEKPLSSYSNLEKMTFANQTLELVAKWRFKPALDSNDNPVTVNVIMPVRVVKYGVNYKALASLDLDDGGKRL